MTDQNPARWSPDPTGRHQYRYWDGADWTDHVSDNGVTGTDAVLPPPDAVTGASDAVPGSSRRLPTWARVVIPVAAVLLGVGFIASVTTSDSTSDERTTSLETDPPVDTLPRTTTSSSTTTTSTTTTTTTTVPPTTVPPTAPPTPPPTEPPAPPPTQAFVAPAASTGCDPNYAGCVPIASDVDCAGGSGNGPAYVSGPVQIIGSDIYDLDSDGDGIGCE